MSTLCQTCGSRFPDDSESHQPVSHFCIGMDGPNLVHDDGKITNVTATSEKSTPATTPSEENAALHWLRMEAAQIKSVLWSKSSEENVVINDAERQK
ncbi:unnamed protein product [Zymoseptoria tritici ST99CH_3D7]|uniref:Uncharacterized protein n=2 Tax=Zymoseptoria tritici TaxID=1047171 RepID=A0A1X7S174_ZYMT9|nr:unnamed protein product [Zymoseptoria tritici ST99CH_3D7]SMR56870.1 unnamed protein product [Zymoseptoria tritici ST99CH_1E4]